MTRSRRVLAALAGLVLLAGCGEAAEEPEAAPSSAATTTSTPAAPSSTPAPTYVGGELGSCFIPQTAAQVRPAELRGQGMQLPGIVFAPAQSRGQSGGQGGDGTVLVLLHQTDGAARCGWGPFGNAIAAAGMTALAFDQCGYGGSDCSVADPDDPVPQVRLALAFARERLDATRVVLVGASMGGNRAVRAVAAGVGVDAWADISGPSVFDDVSLAPLGAEITTPGLVALAADTDGADEAAAAEALAEASGATWVPATDGHGYELLTDDDGAVLPVGQQVLDLAHG